MISRTTKLLVFLFGVGLIFGAAFFLGEQFVIGANSPETFSETSDQQFEKTSHNLPLTEIKRDFGNLPLYFTLDRRTESQEDAKYYSVGNRYGLLLNRSGVVLQLVAENSGNEKDVSEANGKERKLKVEQVKMSFAGAQIFDSPVGEEELAGKVNYLIGNDSAEWQKDNPTFAKVRYKNIYPGIDALFYGNQRELEYDFVVAPTADPGLIKLKFENAKKILIGKNGNLIIKLENGSIVQRKPFAFQTINGRRQEVKVRFVKKGKDEIAFRLGKYDSRKELIIDPIILFSTYWGGSSSDSAAAVRTDSQGNIYLTGATVSPNFPTVNPLQPNIGGSSTFDAFVTKINPAGNSVIYSTYLGGSSDDNATSLTVDSNGNAVVAGRTFSTNFPTANAQQSQSGGGADGFIAKLNASGSALIYSTYLGGSGFDEILGAKLDSSGRPVVAGRTDSGNLPVVQPFQANIAGTSFFRSVNTGESWTGGNLSPNVTNITSFSVNPTSPNIVYAATNIGLFKSMDGGTSWSAIGQTDIPGAVSKIVVAPSNSNILYAIVSGGVFKSVNGGANWTNVSTGLFIFAVSITVDPGNAERVFVGGFGGAVFRTTDGGANWTSVSISGVSSQVTTLLIDPTNTQSVYAGTTQRVYKSTVGGGSWVTSSNGLPFSTAINDLFFDSSSNTIFAATQSGLYKSSDAAANWTLINAANLNSVRALAQSPVNRAHLFAVTTGNLFFRSLDSGANWTEYSGGLTGNNLSAVAASSNALLLGGYTGTDAFVTRLTANGGSIDYSTYFGGNLNDWATGVDVAADNRITFAGTTNSSTLPVVNAVQPVFGGSSDAFAAKFNENGTGLVYSTFLGGTFNDSSNSMTVDSTGAAYLTGSTNSVNFPVVNAFQPNCASCANFITDAYLAKLNANGSSLAFSTFLGGTSSESGTSIAIDSQNRIFVAGSTASANFPVHDPVQPNIGGGTDGFLSFFRADGSGFIYSTFYGGSSTDSVSSVTAAPEGNAVIAGQTVSFNFPVFSPLQTTIGGSQDAFLAKIGTAADLSISITEDHDPVMVNNPLNLDLLIRNNGPSPATGVVVSENIPTGVNFVSAVPTQGNCAINGSALTCNLGNLDVNAQASIRLSLLPTQIGSLVNAITITGNEPDQTAGNNTAVEQTLISALPSIYGKVTTAVGQPADGVGISVEGLENRAVQTGANGRYAVSELPLGGNYLVRPVKAGFYFSPRSRSFSSLTRDETADFVINACTYSLSAESAAFTAAGGTQSIFINTNDPYCSWNAVSNVPWITITRGGGGGVGNGTVRIEVQTSQSQRVGTLTIAGRTFTATQNGCVYTLMPFQQSFGQNGGAGSFEVRTNESFCQWTAQTPNPWININNPNGTGTGVINFSVAAATAGARSGRITVGGQNFSVWQEFNFCPAVNYSAPIENNSNGESNAVVTADFNNDLKPDLATIDTTSSQGSNYSVFIGNGDGTFNRTTLASPIGNLYALTVGDYNRDGNTDLILLGGGRFSVYTGNGSGGFTFLANVNATTSSNSKIFTGDYNRDGNPDLLVGASNRFEVFNGNGNGTFTNGFNQTITGRYAYSFAVGDLNSDGNADLIVGHELDFNVPRLLHYFGAANGTFSFGGAVSLGNITPFSLKAADVNGDGRADALTNGYGASQVQIFLWNAAANEFFPSKKVFTEPLTAYVFDIADMDNDGKPDIVSASTQGGLRVNIMRGNGNGTFRLPVGFSSVRYINDLAFADFNRDGKPDLAFANDTKLIGVQLGVCDSSNYLRAKTARFDFDGDLKADLAVVRPGNNTWYVYQNSTQSLTAQQFGLSTDKYVPADYDGDGRTDLAVFRSSEGVWYRLNSSDNSVMAFQWGKDGDIPVPADFDGDERADLAVYRPGENVWYWIGSLDGRVNTVGFGLTEDVPVVGDYDGDGRADIAVFRPSDGFWYWLNSSDGKFRAFNFGLNGDKAVPADYDGDGKTDFAVFRPSENIWYVMKSADGKFFTARFGSNGDILVPADYDGDGSADIAVYRNGLWYILKSSSGEVMTVQFGLAGDKPVPSTIIR